MVIYYFFNLKVVNNMIMSRFWVWLSHPYNVIAIFELCLSPLCFIFVIQILVHQLHLQGCFLIVCVLLVVTFHEILSPPFCCVSFWCKFLFLFYCWMKFLNLVFVACHSKDGVHGWLEFELFSYKKIKPQLSYSNHFKFNSFDLCSFFILLGPIPLLMIIVILFYFSKPNLSSNYLQLDPHCHVFIMFQKIQAFLF